MSKLHTEKLLDSFNHVSYTLLINLLSVLALGDLAAASFTEDKFGVVQRNIPDILMGFTQLQKVRLKYGHFDINIF